MRRIVSTTNSAMMKGFSRRALFPSRLLTRKVQSRLVHRPLLGFFARRAYSTHHEEDPEEGSDGHINIGHYPPSKFNTILNICPQGHVMVVERFGKLHEIHEPGWFFAIPLVDKVRFKVDQRELTIRIDPQSTITKDNVSVNIGGALYVQIVDPQKACYGARRPLVAITQHAQSSMRSAIGKIDLDDLLHNRKALNSELRESLMEASQPWGMEVKRYEITDVIPDRRVSEAMDQQAVAERDRRQEILVAEAKKVSTIRISEGIKTEYVNTSEGKKQEEILLAEGHRTRVVLESEAERERQINEAQGKAESIMLEAEARARALAVISEQLETDQGRDAMNFVLAEKYTKMLGEAMAQSKTNTVFLPKDVSNISGMVAQGMGVIEAMSLNKQH